MTTRIHQIHIANFKRIEGITVQPKGAVTKVKGRNGAGKSSFIDALQAVLGGEKMRPDHPLRAGAKKGEVQIEFGEYIATLRITETGNSYLSVTGQDGQPVKGGAQAFLNKLIGPGGLAFDPLAFAETLSPKEQAAALMRAVGIDLAPIDAKRRELYEERTVIGRQRDAARAKIPLAPMRNDIPDEEQSAGRVAEKLADWEARRGRFERAKEDHERAIDARNLAAQAVENAKLALKQLEARLEEADRACRRAADAAANAMDDAPSVERLAELRADLRNIDALNALVREKKARREAEAEARRLAEQYDQLTDKLELIERKKAEFVAEAELPVPGLAFTEEGITLNGVPFNQASTAQKLRVGVAVALADRPELRCILIRQGSLLDAESMAALAELVEQHGAQAFVEVVSDDRELTIVDAGK